MALKYVKFHIIIPKAKIIRFIPRLSWCLCGENPNPLTALQIETIMFCFIRNLK